MLDRNPRRAFQNGSCAGGRSTLPLVHEMKFNWLDFPIFLDGIKRFEGCNANALSSREMFERIEFVHDNIEYCFAEGRLMDLAIFFEIDKIASQVSINESPARKEVEELAERLSVRYGLANENASPSWIKIGSDGQRLIWIDQANIISESNRRLFGGSG
jgi:hypothetical protein